MQLEIDFVATWNNLIGKLVGWFDAFVLMLPNIVIAVLALVLMTFLGRLVARGVLKGLDKTHLVETARQLIGRVVRFGFIGLGLVLALSILELDGAVTSLLAGAGVVGLALGFAFQDLASNFISGVGLSLRRPLQTGDIIEHGDTWGTVEKIDLRTTSVRLPDGPLVLVPNKQIYQEKVTIFTDAGERRVDLEIGVSYGDDLELVQRVTSEAIGAVRARIEDRDPEVYFTGFGDSSINLVARFWVPYHRQSEFLAAQSEAIMRVKKAYDDNDVTIPFPIRTLDFGIKGGEKLGEVLPGSEAAA